MGGALHASESRTCNATRGRWTPLRPQALSSLMLPPRWQPRSSSAFTGPQGLPLRQPRIPAALAARNGHRGAPLTPQTAPMACAT
eukprot:15126610-Alexandrium_andersonii.AAC.1